jgi:hypothetical protein
MNDHIQKAFNLADRATSDEEVEPRSRAMFRAIRHQLWLAFGESESAKFERSKEQKHKDAAEDMLTALYSITGLLRETKLGGIAISASIVKAEEAIAKAEDKDISPVHLDNKNR